MVSSIRRVAPVLASTGARARSGAWLYISVVVVLWAFVPELRRIIDWRVGFNSVSIVSVVPLLSLAPVVVLIAARHPRLTRPLGVATWLWTGAFGYAYLIGVLTGNAPSATYTFLNFMLPMCFGIYIATLEVPKELLYQRVADFALALSVPIALYAIYQFVSPPAWDILWIRSSGLVSVGKAAAFSFKPFGTLNGPAAYADVLVGVVALNFARLQSGGFARLAAVTLNLAILALTLVRSDWIALVIAVVVYVALSPRKVQNLTFIAIIGIVLVLYATFAGSLFGSSQAGNALQSRFETLTNLETDTSYRVRQQYFGDALATALREPTGEGLGVTGTAAKLGSAGANVAFDNGYIARFTEMGYFGTLVYLGTIGYMLLATYRRWLSCTRNTQTRSAAIAAVALSLQAALIFLDISVDHHAQLSGILFWLSFALVFGYGPLGEAEAPLAGLKH